MLLPFVQFHAEYASICAPCFGLPWRLLRNSMVQGHHRGGSEGALYPPYAQPPPPPPIPQHQRPSMQWHAGVQSVVVLWSFADRMLVLLLVR